MNTGYCDCPCRDCFEVSITDAEGLPSLCGDCDDAGCQPNSECQADGAYGSYDDRGSGCFSVPSKGSV